MMCGAALHRLSCGRNIGFTTTCLSSGVILAATLSPNCEGRVFATTFMRRILSVSSAIPSVSATRKRCLKSGATTCSATSAERAGVGSKITGLRSASACATATASMMRLRGATISTCWAGWARTYITHTTSVRRISGRRTIAAMRFWPASRPRSRSHAGVRNTSNTRNSTGRPRAGTSASLFRTERSKFGCCKAFRNLSRRARLCTTASSGITTRAIRSSSRPASRTGGWKRWRFRCRGCRSCSHAGHAIGIRSIMTASSAS